MTENDIKKVSLPETITVKKFSEVLDLPLNNVIAELMKNGIIATINEKIDFETASIIASDLGFEVSEETTVKTGEMTLEKLNEEIEKEKNSEENLKNRPPIVTILGHVDHGKTTLLDTIRKSDIAAKESGGITQHITAYQVKKKGNLITFVDTPGHEAFSSMRERGVNIADIAVLVVAADDGVRPQTKEVAEYLIAKKIPTVVAINKIDKPGINIQRIKKELGEIGIVLEEWGGEFLGTKISAKNNVGIDDLLDNILLISEIENFKANFSRDPLGIILESNLDPQKGPVATVLMKTGTLKVGQDVIAGDSQGRIKRIENFREEKISEATPSMPVNIIGLDNTPNSNDILHLSIKKSNGKTKSDLEKSSSLIEKESLNAQKMMRVIADKKVKRLNIILKSDVQGSLEAIAQILDEIKSNEVAIDYIATGIGNITESDVRLAEDSGSIIYGFNVEITPVAKRMTESANVEVKNYKIIYELIEDIKEKLVEMLPPIIERTDFGKLKVLAIFKTGKGDMIIGGRVVSGKMKNESLIEVIRDDKIIGKGQLKNLQENKVDVDEVKNEKECGITFIGETKIKVDDIIISYKEKTKKKKL